MKDGEILVQERTKEPFFGYLGFISGKIRFGETVYESAHRELKEETGLKGKLQFHYILHEHILSREQKLLEDKFFYVVKATNLRDKLKDTTDGKNKFIERKKFLKMKKIFYDVKDILKYMSNANRCFIEKTYLVDEF